MTTKEKEAWHLSKSVPISLLVGLLLQLAGFAWYAGQVTERVNTNSSDIIEMRSREDQLESRSNAQAVQLGRIEENIRATRDTLSRIERKLDGNRSTN